MVLKICHSSLQYLLTMTVYQYVMYLASYSVMETNLSWRGICRWFLSWLHFIAYWSVQSLLSGMVAHWTFKRVVGIWRLGHEVMVMLTWNYLLLHLWNCSSWQGTKSLNLWLYLNFHPFDSFKTLGVFISPSDSMKKAMAALLSYSINYASYVFGSSWKREEALCSYIVVVIPKLSFFLSALTLTEQQCRKMQSPGICAVLPSSI